MSEVKETVAPVEKAKISDPVDMSHDQTMAVAVKIDALTKVIGMTIDVPKFQTEKKTGKVQFLHTSVRVSVLNQQETEAFKMRVLELAKLL